MAKFNSGQKVLVKFGKKGDGIGEYEEEGIYIGTSWAGQGYHSVYIKGREQTIAQGNIRFKPYETVKDKEA